MEPTTEVTISPPTTSARLFSQAREIKTRVLHPDFPDGKKWCVVRYPTDEQWCARERRRLLIVRSLGRDASQEEIPDAAEIDLELFKVIRQDKDGPAFDAAEASMIIERICRTTVTGTRRDGNRYMVELDLPGNVSVSHSLLIPTQKQIMEFEAGSIHRTSRKNTREFRFSPEPYGDLWDKLNRGAVGYEGGAVPILHKQVALRALLDHLAAEMEEDDPES